MISAARRKDQVRDSTICSIGILDWILEMMPGASDPNGAGRMSQVGEGSQEESLLLPSARCQKSRSEAASRSGSIL